MDKSLSSSIGTVLKLNQNNRLFLYLWAENKSVKDSNDFEDEEEFVI